MPTTRWPYDGKIGELIAAYLRSHPVVWKDAELTACAPGDDTPTEWVRPEVLQAAMRWARGQNLISEHFATFMETLCRRAHDHIHNYEQQEEVDN